MQQKEKWEKNIEGDGGSKIWRQKKKKIKKSQIKN